MYKTMNSLVIVAMVFSMVACSSNSSAPVPVTPATSNDVQENGDLLSIGTDAAACVPAGVTVAISGTVSYERVPFSLTPGNGLDYNNIQTLPIRGAEIQALGAADCVMASGVTSSTGTYSIAVEQSTALKIRVKAKTTNVTGAIWDFEVRDNTSGNNLYVLDGASVDSGTVDSTRTMTAVSGWTGSAYGIDRNAGPFAILDSIYDAVQTVVAIDSSVNMDDADIFWSVNNSTTLGTLSNGEIGSSFYANDQLYLLGAADSNTDEYDAHVIIHEWGHYFEDNLSRSDSIGGSLTINSKLDMRVALSEGFGFALAGIVTGTSVYRDSSGAAQGSDTSVDLESNTAVSTGWFSKESVHTILYDIYDANVDANDAVNLGFAPIYNAMISTTYKTQPSHTTIFSLMDKIQDDIPGSLTELSTLVNSQNIATIVDQWGSNETNNGGDANNLATYKLIDDTGIPVQVCSSKAEGESNRLGNRQHLLLTVGAGGSKTVAVSRVSGLALSDPDIRVYLNGTLTFTGASSINNSETVVGNFATDEYVVEVSEFSNVDNNSGTGGDVCFNVTVN